jgi:DNA-binding transcriptional LysR family regulator
MQIESLKVFCDLAETQSFTKAAEVNSVTQSAVSQTITALEKQFKSLLIERSKKNFRLTIEGDLVYDMSKRILQSYEALQSKMQELRNEICGQVRIATVYSIGLYDLPTYVKRFMKDHPEVNLRVEYRREPQVYEGVLGNIVDLGLAAYPIRDAKLQIVPLHEDPLVLICPPQHPLARQKTLKLKALTGQKLVSFSTDITTRKALDRMLKAEGAAVEHVMEFDNIETIKRAVEIGLGVALVPEKTVQQEVAGQTLAAVKLEGNPRREVALFYKKDKVLSPAMKAFIDLLKEAR